MAGTEMKNVVLIALVVLILLFVVYQYDPSFFGVFRSYEGFESMNGKNGKGPGSMANANYSTKAGANGNSSGRATQAITESNPNSSKAQGADPQSAKAFGNQLKVSPPTALPSGQGVQGAVDLNAPGANKATEAFADLSAYEGPASFGAAEAPAGCYPRDQLTPSELLPRDMNSIWAEQNPMGPGSLKGKNFLSAGALIGVNTVGQSLRNANLQIRSEPPNPQVPISIFNQSTIAPDISHRPLEIGA
jgi:hypothetical protein